MDKFPSIKKIFRVLRILRFADSADSANLNSESCKKKNIYPESCFPNLKTFEKNRISNLDSNLQFSANLRILRILRFEQKYSNTRF